jgi:hypothetical protein
MRNIYRAVNAETGETHEGSIIEIAGVINAQSSTLRSSFSKGTLAYGVWKVEKIADGDRRNFEKVCVICGKQFWAYRPQMRYCCKKCQKAGQIKMHAEWVAKQKAELEKAGNKKRCIIKDKSVCKGCKYNIVKCQFHIFNNTCDYLSQTGRSRIVVEMENGGIKADSCICYEKGPYREHGKQPICIRRVR